mgnify:CR=1 FL=1
MDPYEILRSAIVGISDPAYWAACRDDWPCRVGVGAAGLRASGGPSRCRQPPNPMLAIRLHG